MNAPFTQTRSVTDTLYDLLNASEELREFREKSLPIMLAMESRWEANAKAYREGVRNG